MKKKILGAFFEGEGKLSLRETVLSELKNDEVLLEVESASICGTDVHILAVPPGHPANCGVILGHEYGGRIVKVGKSVKNLKIDDRVVVDPNITCGYCSFCSSGLPNMCKNMTTLGIFINGGFAEYSIAPEKALHKISKDVPKEFLPFAEPLSCITNGINKLDFKLGDSVLILGAGPIGLIFCQCFKAAGAGKIAVSEVSEFRSKFAKKSGADFVINPQKDNFKNLSFDIVVDAVGTLLKESIHLVKPGGQILLFGMNKNAKCELQQYDLTRGEIKIIGTYIANRTFPQAIKILEGNLLNLKELITHKLKLTEIKKGIELMRKGEAIKIIILPKGKK